MSEIRCPNCGRNNPDLLDVCQFCQAPLKPDPTLRAGDKPTKKNTGELEPILPDWLKDMRQQAKSAAEEEQATRAAAESRLPRSEPQDLLAGLASQAAAEDEDVPDWLASLSPPAAAPSPRQPDTDPFARLREKEPEPGPQEASFGTGDTGPQPPAEEKDELSEWFARAAESPEGYPAPEEQPGAAGSERPFDAPPAPGPAAAEEDLGWLRDLEAASKKTAELESPGQAADWRANVETPPTPSPAGASGEDLSWLDRLGAIDEPPAPAAESAAAPGDDLSWLDRFGGIEEAAQQPGPSGPREDLSWLNELGAVPESRPVDAAPNQPIPPPFLDEEAQDWPARPETRSDAAGAPTSAEDLSWLNELGRASPPTPAPPFTEAAAGPQKTSPRQTAPLGKEAREEPEPDWLRDATQAPSMPAPGDLSMDWFTGSAPPEKTPAAEPRPSPTEGDIFGLPPEPAPISNQEVDSLLAAEMPDWLSEQQPQTADSAAEPAAEARDSLAPVDLPPWVQAMRPVEAMIEEPAAGVSDQPAETEGPLAGLHGVIPIAPVAPSKRPKPVSLTLQASTEQQASALLLEEILGSETSPRSLVASSTVTSQQWLRWGLAVLVLLVLSAAILFGSQRMPISSGLQRQVGGISNAVMGIPTNSRLLVVIDYEPSLAGEMEAIAAPLLDQVILLSRPDLSFISTSTNGPALAERLMADPRINAAGLPYRNLGYLPGGSAGALGFIQAPGQIVPLAGVGSFSDYAALIVLTDHAESGRVWVEQLQSRKQADPALGRLPLLMVASAQAGPLLQPYVSSGQVSGLISGMSDAAPYEALNNGRPGIVRSYWDTFGAGLLLSVVLIVIGSLWSLTSGIRARRASPEQG